MVTASRIRKLMVILVTLAVMATVALSATSAHAAGTFTGVSKPTVSGTRAVGKALTAKHDTKTTPTAKKVTYQWLRNGAKISKATANSYRAKAADKGKRLAVKVCYQRSGYTTRCVTSAQTATIKAGTLTASTPKIVGVAKVGAKLRVQKGTWTTGTTFSYKWLRSGTVISGATSSTYTVKSADKGKQISVKVTGKKSGYSTRSKTSARGAAVTNLSSSQKKAVSQARLYLTYFDYSRSGLIGQLAYEGIGSKTAAVAVDYVNPNWSHQALWAARTYVEYSSMSKSGMERQLKADGFTSSQVKYAMANISVSWNAEALQSARSHVRDTSVSKSQLISQLRYEGFTQSQVDYALKNLTVSWNKQAAKAAKQHMEWESPDRDELISWLRDWNGFTQSQAIYGANAVGL